MTQTKRKVEAYFPTLVQYSQVEDLQEMNKTLLPAIEEIKRTIPNTVPSDGSSIHYSTINSGENIIGLENFAALRAFIMAEGINFANTLGLNIQKQPLKLDESWLNVHGDREYQEPHIHPNSVISGVYYAKAPNNCGDLLIHSPFIYVMHQPLLKGQNDFNARTYNISPKAGLLVLFRSFLEHSVNPNLSNQERISISMNFTM